MPDEPLLIVIKRKGSVKHSALVGGDFDPPSVNGPFSRCNQACWSDQVSLQLSDDVALQSASKKAQAGANFTFFPPVGQVRPSTQGEFKRSSRANSVPSRGKAPAALVEERRRSCVIL